MMDYSSKADAVTRTGTSRAHVDPAARGRGFTLVDLLISIAVMTTLIAVLLPAVGGAREIANRTKCKTNIRQLGMGVQMHAYDYKGIVPQSVFSNERKSYAYAPQETVHLRVSTSLEKFLGATRDDKDRWDGLGLLYERDYMDAPQVFYCPNNRGLHMFDDYAAQFAGESGPIVGNYQYRLIGQREYLSSLDPQRTLISNATRSPEEYSHKIGNNMLKADMSVRWFDDSSGSILKTIAAPAGADREEGQGVEYAWKIMDSGKPTMRGSGSSTGDTSGYETDGESDESQLSGR